MTAYATTTELRDYLDQVAGWTMQTIQLSGSPTGGSFTLSYGGQTTGALAYNATAAAVQAALVALSSIGANKAKVSGPAGGPWVVKLEATLSDSAQPIVLASNSLTGGSSPNVSIAKATDDLLQDCLDRARSIVDTALGFGFFDAGAAWPSASTKKVRSEASTWLRLPPYQEGSVTEIALASDTTDVVDADDYEEDWDAGKFYLYREDGWEDVRYAVTAKYGYGPAPASIAQLNLELAVNIWRAKAKGMFVEVGAEGGGQIRFVGGLTKQQQLIVAGIRRQFVDVVY